MEPIVVLITGFVALVVVGRDRWSWIVSLRIALAAMFLLTGVAHFGPGPLEGLRADMIRMVPPVFPRPDVIVTLTGIAEVAGAIALLVPRTARLAAACLTVLMLAMFPANVYAALNGIHFDGAAPEPLWIRTLEELVFLAAGVGSALDPSVRKAEARAA
ncbi:MAG: DoxX family membrane protein [Polyangiaceae bacterium]|nr:DoxX family membrane protein [Polyangiaceae bacterium]